MTNRNLRKVLFTLLFAMSADSQSFGQVVYQYSFGNLCGDLCTFASPFTGTPDVLATGLSSSSWATDYASGFISYTGACGNMTCQSLAISSNNYPATTSYTLTFAVNPNYALNISGLSFWNRESNTGPTTANITINGTSAVSNVALAGLNWAGTGTLTPTGTFNNLTGTMSVVITLSGATGTSGTFRLDSFIIDGVVSALDVAFDVTGGGSLCAGGAAVPIGLSGSQTGHTYQLFNGSNSVSQPVAGTGNAIAFGDFSAAGTYTVVATNTGTSVITNMNDSAIVIVNPLPVISPSPAITTCATIYTLDAGPGGASYAWSNGATDETVTVNTSDYYGVTVTSDSGCVASAIDTITFSSALQVVITPSQNPVCSGKTVSISATGGVNYTWSNSSTTSSIDVAPTANTLYSVTATGSTPDCSATASINIATLNPSASTISKSICTGDSYNGHTVTGSYSDTLASSNGCDSVVSLSLFVSGPGTVTVSQIICTGQTYNGHNATGNYSDTLLSASGCDSVVALTLTVLPGITDTIYHGICKYDTFMGHTTTGTYRDTLTSAFGCDSIVVLHLKVHSLPYITDSLPFDTVCNNHVGIALSGATPAGGTYYGQGVSNGVFTPSSAVLGNDTIYYSYTDTNGCYNSYWELAYVESCDTVTGINTIAANSFVVSPNPTTGLLNIESNDPALTYGYQLLDLLGRQMINTTEGAFDEKNSVDLRNLPAGVYLLNVQQNQIVILTRKIVKL